MFNTEEELLQKMAETIEQTTGLAMETEKIKELLIEVQHEQLKGLVYRTFMKINQENLEKVQVVSEQTGEG
jgi:hypothetical protein